MGHVQYYLQYKHLPKIYRRGANAGTCRPASPAKPHRATLSAAMPCCGPACSALAYSVLFFSVAELSPSIYFSNLSFL